MACFSLQHVEPTDASPQSKQRSGGENASSGFLSDALCALDGSAGSIAAVEQAATLAGAGGHLTLLEVTSFRNLGEYRGPVINPVDSKSILDRAVEIAKEAGVSHAVEVDPDAPPWKVILEWSDRHSFLAMGSPSTSWFGGFFLGGATDAALGDLASPLLVARPTPSGDPLGGRIVIASDGLPGSDALVEFAGELASSRGASVTLAHALTPLERKARRERVEAQASKLEGLLGDSLDVHMRAGTAHKVLAELAGESAAALVVMGSRRVHGVRALGSVTRRFAHEGPCSAMLVPPEYLSRNQP